MADNVTVRHLELPRCTACTVEIQWRKVRWCDEPGVEVRPRKFYHWLCAPSGAVIHEAGDDPYQVHY